MFVGRENEIKLLKKSIIDSNSHFIAVYGRRRIGKTYLIKEAFGERFTFQHAGVFEGDLKTQLYSFDNSLRAYGLNCKTKSKNWLDAFDKLKQLIKASKEGKKIIFIDELSWLDTSKSGLITALENFWNGWASLRNDVVLVVCASATQWILSNIVHNKGGLYNRLTDQICLQPFSLNECEKYIFANKLNLNREQILQGYMIFGGVPYYWSLLERGKSLSQNIDDLFFLENAKLKDEYKYLYASIYKNPDVYIRIIETLVIKKIGLNREDIIKYSKLVNSGDISKKLEELESCGFIRKYICYGSKKKGIIYQLIDMFTLFYYQFLTKEVRDEHYWTHIINTPEVNSWMGFAFEKVCLLHIREIKEKLGISGIQTDINSWQCKKDEDRNIFGSQIDMLIVRKDKVINLCEMKYSNTEYTVTSKFIHDIFRKISDFQAYTKTRYSIHTTLVTTYGLVDNSYSNDIQSLIVLDDLYKQV